MNRFQCVVNIKEVESNERFMSETARIFECQEETK